MELRPARVRIGLAGVGLMGRNHLRVMLDRPDVSVVAIAEPSPTARAGAAALIEQAGAPEPLWFGDTWEMLAEERLDAAVIATPSESHADTVRMAIEERIPVLIEKPLAVRTADAVDLVDAVARSGAFVQVGHVERFNPAVAALDAAIRSGACGEMLTVRATRTGPPPRQRMATGVALDLATHDVDVVCHLLRAVPRRVAGEAAFDPETGVDTMLLAMLHFDGEVSATVEASWLNPDKERTLTVVGRGGVMQLDYLRRTLSLVTAVSGDVALIDGFAPSVRGRRREYAVPRHEPLALQLDAFLSSLNEGRPPVVGVEDGARAVSLVSQALQAAATGRPVTLEAEGTSAP